MADRAAKGSKHRRHPPEINERKIMVLSIDKKNPTITRGVLVFGKRAETLRQAAG